MGSGKICNYLLYYLQCYLQSIIIRIYTEIINKKVTNYFMKSKYL